MPPRRRGAFGWRRPVAASADPLADAPIKRWATLAFTGDVVAAVVAAIAARVLRFGFEDAIADRNGLRVPYAALGIGLAVCWPIATSLAGAYGYRVALLGVEDLRRILRAGFGLLAAVGVLHFMLQLEVARGFVGIFIPLVVVLSIAWRLALRRRMNRDQRLGYDRHRAVIVGDTAEIDRVRRSLDGLAWSPIEIVGIVPTDLPFGADVPLTLGNLARIPSVAEIAAARAAGMSFDVLLYAGRPEAADLWTLARHAHENHVALAMAPERHDHSNVAWSYVPLGSTPLLLVQTPGLSPAHRVTKSLFDRALATFLVLVLSPLLLGIALAILIRDGRPVFFRHRRVGRGGSSFRVWKFRTMVPDAEAKLFELMTEEQRNVPLFKVRNDPRVTKTGSFLRKYSLDELPQLFNVVVGEMSLVGPRPQVEAEVATYDERAARRLLVKPGMTGLWQTHGRNDMPWDEGVYLDLLYVDHWSPLLDLVIMAKTVKAVLKPHGAY